jgi:hypothetical protein
MFSLSNASEGRRLDMSYVREWAQEIASSYLNEQIEPTTALQKIASEQELNPHQICLVAGEANKEIHRIKFASVSDKYFAADFPLADAKHVITSLQADTGEVKVAGFIPAPIYDKEEIDMFSAFGVKEEDETFSKTASLKSDMKATLLKAELFLEKSAERIEMRRAAVDSQERSFIKQARQYVLGSADDQAGRLKAIGDLSKVASEINFGGAQKALAKLAFVLGREGLLTVSQATDTAKHFMKQAQCEVPDGLFDRNLPLTVVNGVHPIYVTLKTYNSHAAALDGDMASHRLVEDRVRILRQKMRVM